MIGTRLKPCTTAAAGTRGEEVQTRQHTQQSLTAWRTSAVTTTIIQSTTVETNCMACRLAPACNTYGILVCILLYQAHHYSYYTMYDTTFKHRTDDTALYYVDIVYTTAIGRTYGHRSTLLVVVRRSRSTLLLLQYSTAPTVLYCSRSTLLFPQCYIAPAVLYCARSTLLVVERCSHSIILVVVRRSCSNLLLPVLYCPRSTLLLPQ